ncbi:MAG: ABC transporter permease [Myxococcales bacterium]|nr:ABC transporter permease [Myxococcales bacterium]
MNPLVTVRLAIIALLRNKMRSFLTMLGVIIGVGAVIAVVAIGEGAKAQVASSFAAMGTDLLIVMPGSTSSGGAAGGFGTGPTLTWDDLKAMQTELSSVKSAAPSLRSNAQILGEEQNWSTGVTGTTPDYFVVRNWGIDKGIAFGQSDVDSSSKVVVLGATVSTKLFGESGDPVGQIVRIKSVPFEVIGVAAKKGQSPMGQDYDDTVFIPSSTYQRFIGKGLQKYLNGTIFVAANSTAEVPKAQQEIVALLRDRHHLAPNEDDDFSVRSLAEVADAQAQSTNTLTTLLTAIAAVSLLVGGIGIMNIMLVSVTERTREIGVRMAIGAKPRHILAQFLAEAVAISMVGGLLGVGIGTIAAQRIALQFKWPTLIRPDVTLIAVAFSALVGIGFGLYPARKASKLDPIQALRFE